MRTSSANNEIILQQSKFEHLHEPNFVPSAESFGEHPVLHLQNDEDVTLAPPTTPTSVSSTFTKPRESVAGPVDVRSSLTLATEEEEKEGSLFQEQGQIEDKPLPSLSATRVFVNGDRSLSRCRRILIELD